MVNFMCQLDLRIREAQIAGKTLFLGMSARVLEEIYI